jgi:hypothetical protein
MTGRPCPPHCDCGRHRPPGAILPPERVSQHALHRRLNRARGRAAAHLCDGYCGSPAHDWARLHGTSGWDFGKDYIPLCRKCHLAYDREARQNPQSVARKSASIKRALAAQPAEVRAARSRTNLGEWASDWTPGMKAAHASRQRARTDRARDAYGRFVKP